MESQILPLTLRADAELGSLLRAFPTGSDIEALVNRLEASHRKEITKVRLEVQLLSDRMTTGESSVSKIEKRLRTVENHQTSQAATILAQQLQIEEIEDCSRRNNFKAKGPA